jgi:hypothetical protein
MRQSPSRRPKDKNKLPETVHPYMQMSKKELESVLFNHKVEFESLLLQQKYAGRDAGDSKIKTGNLP